LNYDTAIDIIKVKIPIRLRSEANIAEHWRKKYAYRKKMLKIVDAYFPKNLPKLPCNITITRIAPRTLDDDNFVYSCKNLRDYIADKLIPNLAPGRADNSNKICFNYQQKKGNPKEYAVELIFEHALLI